MKRPIPPNTRQRTGSADILSAERHKARKEAASCSCINEARRPLLGAQASRLQ
jgi:hypothetical protein